MTTKWTEGPWETIQHGDFLDVIQAGRDGYGCVCRIENADIDPPQLKQQAEVDAKLIAKAPEMAELLHKFLSKSPLVVQLWMSPLLHDAERILREAGAIEG